MNRYALAALASTHVPAAAAGNRLQDPAFAAMRVSGPPAVFIEGGIAIQ